MHPEERTSAKALAPHTAGFAVLGGIPMVVGFVKTVKMEK